MPKKKQYVYLQGKSKWPRLITPNKFGKWSITLYPNEASYQKILELKEGPSGIKNVISKDEDGYYVSFTRPQQKMMRGKVVGFAPPEILSADGVTPLRDVIIGNGSDITLKIEVYYYKPPIGPEGSAARLMSVRVDNLIPFDGHHDFDEDQSYLVKGMEEQPPQLF